MVLTRLRFRPQMQLLSTSPSENSGAAVTQRRSYDRTSTVRVSASQASHAVRSPRRLLHDETNTALTLQRYQRSAHNAEIV
jgi:hypothetical protein